MASGDRVRLSSRRSSAHRDPVPRNVSQRWPIARVRHRSSVARRRLQLGQRQSRALIVPCHRTHLPAGWRQNELSRDHSAGFESDTFHGARLGIGAEPMCDVAEDLNGPRKLRLVEAGQFSRIDRRLARRDELANSAYLRYRAGVLDEQPGFDEEVVDQFVTWPLTGLEGNSAEELGGKPRQLI